MNLCDKDIRHLYRDHIALPYLQFTNTLNPFHYIPIEYELLDCLALTIRELQTFYSLYLSETPCDLKLHQPYKLTVWEIPIIFCQNHRHPEVGFVNKPNVSCFLEVFEIRVW